MAVMDRKIGISPLKSGPFSAFLPIFLYRDLSVEGR
jgi:hypothetical protein